jgi:Putative beta barrel porin-7 (BBP7)
MVPPFLERLLDMIRIAICLAAIAHVPLAAVMAQQPAGNAPANRGSVSYCQAPVPTPAAPNRVGQLSDQNSACAPADGPMGLGSMEAAIRSASTTNIPWNDLGSSRPMWVSLEYLGVWIKGSHAPSPASAGPTGAAQPAGMAGQPAGTIPFGDHLNAEMGSGGRITAGAWLPGETLGVEASFFAVETGAAHSSAAAAAR